ncbi:MAG TPA: hypothetical protein DCX27_11335 [Balneola sp.]|nr:hypothetical protein [Balneola sp.]
MERISMKLSKGTLAVLKNYSSINTNILVQPGSKISTITPAKNLLSEAIVEEVFSTQFGIWDLPKFLGTVSLFADPDFEFNEKYVLIKSSSGSCVKYYYAEPSLLTVPTKQLEMPTAVVSFKLTESIFNEIMRSASVLQLPDLAIRSDSDKVIAVVFDKSEPTSNDYSIDLGDHVGDGEFDFHFKIDNLKFLPGEYEVDISNKIVSQFTNTSKSVTYWVALESTSTYSE